MTPDAPLFSVLVTAYNRPEYLEESLASVLAQTVDDFECIVVDDASPTPLAVPDDPRFRLVRHEVNRGPAAARNTGMRHARGRYVVFLDDDDRFTPDRLALALEGLERAPLALCRSRRMDDASPEDGPDQAAGMLEGDVSATIRNGITHSLGQVAIERAALLPFNEDLIGGQDTEWWIRTAQEVRVTTVPRVGHIFRVHDGVRHGNSMASRLEAHRMIVELHADYFARHPQAAAFQYGRMGLTAIKAGDRHAAVGYLWRSMRLKPQPKTAWHLGRALLVRPARAS